MKNDVWVKDAKGKLHNLSSKGCLYTDRIIGEGWKLFSERGAIVSNLTKEEAEYIMEEAARQLNAITIQQPKFAAPSNAELKSAAERGQELLHEGLIATRVHYNCSSGYLWFDIKGDVTREKSFVVRARSIHGLQNATRNQIANFELHPSGYAINWPELDVQMTIKGLYEGLYGNPSWTKRQSDEEIDGK